MRAQDRQPRYKDEHLKRALEGEEFLLLDGGLGTMIQRAGLSEVVSPPDLLNLTHGDAIEEIHRSYVEAGSEVITTNTFNTNPNKLEGKASVEEVFDEAAKLAREAGARYVAGDIGPTGTLLEPLGTMSFDDAYDQFAIQVQAAEKAGCDLILIETMSDLREAKAAVLAALENTSLPVVVSMSFDQDGRTFLGTTPQIAATTLSNLGADAVGLNCSLGPNEMVAAVQAVKHMARSTVVAQPNAGLPKVVDGKTVYDMDAETFAEAMRGIIDAGATVIGGCCGTDPIFIKALRKVIDDYGAPPDCRGFKDSLAICSAQEIVEFPEGSSRIGVIGERINPTGKKRLQAALKADEVDYVVAEAVAQVEAGADILDVNVGLPEIDEAEMLFKCVEELQSCVPAPLQIDSADAEAIVRTVRRYPGRPLINSVNGKQSSLEAILPIAAKYGCSVLGLTLDEDGIPSSAEGRAAIARRIVGAAEACGIPKSDVVIDCLTMAAATNQDEAREILRAIQMVKEQLGVCTVLGVSNISFGLPHRSLMNSVFLSAAFGAGLDMAIMDPLNERAMDVVDSFRVICGEDQGARSYIEKYANARDPYISIMSIDGTSLKDGAGARDDANSTSGNPSHGSAGCPIPVPSKAEDFAEEVCAIADYVLSGRPAPMRQAVSELMTQCDPLVIVNDIFIPLLDLVGKKYDEGEFFLPQLMSSAEAVKAGFDVIRSQQEGVGNVGESGSGTVLLATVQGDIHDIGKNIVRMLMENYGIDVLDLGRDVAPEEILEAVQENDIKLVGLSALMTTTVKAMEQTIQLLRKEAPGASVMVGGAVLTPDYAEQIGADFYAKDAAESAQLATRFFREQGSL